MFMKVNDIILGTGSYDSVRSGNTVSVTGSGGNAWGYYGPACKKMAPRLVTYLPYAEKLEKLQELKQDINNLKMYLEYRKQIEDEYIRSFYELRLHGLDVYQMLEELKSKFGEQIILLCHEPVEEFCHRRLWADFIELETGIYIPEVTVSSDGMVKKINPIRYKNRLKDIVK